MEYFLLIVVSYHSSTCSLEPTALEKRTVSINIKNIIKKGNVFYEFQMRLGGFLFVCIRRIWVYKKNGKEMRGGIVAMGS